MIIRSVFTVTRYAVSRSITTALLISGIACGSLASAAPPTGSAYFNDLQNSHVEDATSQGIGQVNMITCIMSAMKPDALVNQGNYIALVDENKCSANKSSTSNAGGGDASQATSYTTTTVNSTRVSNADPMLVKVWLDEDNDGQPSTIFVDINATEAPSTANPYGQFRLDFCGKDNGVSGACSMQGMLQGANGALSYYQNEQRSGGSSTTALRLSSVGTTSGSGKLDTIQSQNNTTQEVSFLFAYDSTRFLRGDQCFSRDATDPATGLSVWSYGVYDATTGARAVLNSGFPINYTNGGVTYHGYLGYWGLSLPAAAQATLVTGSTVQKVDYSNGNTATTTNFTAVVAGGKLTKYTKKSRTLRALDKISFDTFVNDVTGFITNAVANAQYEMYWDDAQQLFVVTGQMDCSQNGCQLHSFDTPQTIAASFWTTQGGIQGWSQALGGEVYINLHTVSSPLDSSTVSVVYRTQDVVYPADIPATLYCVNNCPTATSLTDFLANNIGTSPFDANTFNNWNPSANVVTYNGNTSTAVLTTGGQPVVFTDMNAYQQHSQYQNGVRSGRLFTTLSDASCGANVYCDYKANDLDVYYVWETGPSNWNQFVAVRDANNAFLKFDAPLQLNYLVPTGSQYGQYAGKTIVLQYGGFGNLWGIPGQCVSSLTNQLASCDTDNARFVPQFVIPFDATLGQTSDGTHNYLIKWLDREIRFARKDISVCSGLTLPSSITLPTAADLLDPTDPTSSSYIGNRPAVTGEPRVIQGEVKY